MLLYDIAPDVFAKCGDARVIVFGTPECPACERTIKLLRARGIEAVKFSMEEKYHPLLVWAREQLGLDKDALIKVPIVIVDGEFAWNDMNMAEISALAARFKQEALELVGAEAVA